MSVVIASSMVSTPAHADSLVYDDSGDGVTTSVALSKVTFTNGRMAVTVRAIHPSLDAAGIEASIAIDVPGPLAFYALRDDRGELSLSRENMNIVRCDGDRTMARSAQSGKPGWVTFRIPHSCLKNSKRVRMNYALGNFDYTQWEYAPDGPTDDGRPITRWIRRTP